MTTDIQKLTDHALAARLAGAACRLLDGVRRDAVLEDRALGDAGDAIANVFLTRSLAHARPNDAVLSEETADEAGRVNAERVWIVDPLDGTREYSEGRADCAVHVALAINGEPVAGAVALPGDEVYSTVEPPARRSSSRSGLRIAVSRSRPPAEAAAVAEALDAELVELGSAGYKTMAVVRGEVDAYLHSGGQYAWDSAAPVAVARAAGLHASRIDGSALIYDAAEPYLPDLVVCRPDLTDDVLGAISAGTVA